MFLFLFVCFSFFFSRFRFEVSLLNHKKNSLVEILKVLEQQPADLDVPLTVTCIERDKKNEENVDQFKQIFENTGVSLSVFFFGRHKLQTTKKKMCLIEKLIRISLARWSMR